MPALTKPSQENSFPASSRVPTDGRWRPSHPAANNSQSPDTQEIRSRIALLALLHARFLFRGINPSSSYPYTGHSLRSIKITGPEDYNNLRQQIRLPISRTAPQYKVGCTFLDWLEHIAWLLGKSPLALNPLGLNPAFYSLHTMFFGDYGNNKIPSTVAVTRWVKPYIWDGLLKTHQLLLAVPLRQTAELLATPLTPQHFCPPPAEIAQAAAMIGNYIAHLEKAWDNYRCFAFSQ